MTIEQYNEMMEFAKEEIDSIMDYLEVNYDEVSQEDISMLYRVVLEEIPEAEEKEELHRALLEAMYEMAEQNPKNLMKGMQKVKACLEQ